MAFLAVDAAETGGQSYVELSETEASLVEAIDQPIFLLDQERFILWRNARSLEAAALEIFPADAGRFTLRDPGADEELAAFLGEVFETAAAKEAVVRTSPTGVALALSGRRRNTILLRPPSIASAQSRAFVVLRLKPAAARPLDFPATLGLSPVERRLVAHLAGGRTVKEASKELGISYHTARKYLQNVFVKTGARRQAELVALISRPSGRS